MNVIIFAATLMLLMLSFLHLKKWKIEYFALLYYLVEKDYTPPDREKMEECRKIVMEKLMKESFPLLRK